MGVIPSREVEGGSAVRIGESNLLMKGNHPVENMSIQDVNDFLSLLNDPNVPEEQIQAWILSSSSFLM